MRAREEAVNRRLNLGHAKLTINDLLKIGLLTDEPAFAYVVMEGRTFCITWYPEECFLKTMWLDLWQPGKAFVDLVREKRLKQDQWYFRCQNTGRTCSSLSFNGREWIDRPSEAIRSQKTQRPAGDRVERELDRRRLRFLGQDGRRRPRPAARGQLLAYFRKHPQYVGDHPDLLVALEAEEFLLNRPRLSQRRSSQSDMPLSTLSGLKAASADDRQPARDLYKKETAFKKGSMAGYPVASLLGDEAADVFARPSAQQTTNFCAWAQTIPMLRLPPRDRPIELIEDTPSLDCHTIMSLIANKTAGMWAFAIRWVVGGAELRFSGILSAFEAERHLVYIQRDGMAGVLSRQVIPVTVNGSGKKLFVCPMSAKSVARLFYRDGVFACSQEQRLVSASQRKRSKF